MLVQGSSMIPTLIEGQHLHTVFSEFHPKPGDLLLFRQVDYLVVHRYLGRCRTREGQPAFRTRGDGRLFLDPAVLPEKVVGLVVAARYGERWLSFRGTRARWYGRAVAAHCFGWTAVGVVARKADRLFARLKLPEPWVRSAEFLDRLALGCAHVLFFRISHREVPAPPLPAAPGD